MPLACSRYTHTSPHNLWVVETSEDHHLLRQGIFILKGFAVDDFHCARFSIRLIDAWINVGRGAAGGERRMWRRVCMRACL